MGANGMWWNSKNLESTQPNIWNCAVNQAQPCSSVSWRKWGAHLTEALISTFSAQLEQLPRNRFNAILLRCLQTIANSTWQCVKPVYNGNWHLTGEISHSTFCCSVQAALWLCHSSICQCQLFKERIMYLIWNKCLKWRSLSPTPYIPKSVMSTFRTGTQKNEQHKKNLQVGSLTQMVTDSQTSGELLAWQFWNVRARQPSTAHTLVKPAEIRGNMDDSSRSVCLWNKEDKSEIL